MKNLKKLFLLFPLAVCAFTGCTKNNGLSEKVDDAVKGVKLDESSVDLKVGGLAKVVKAELELDGEPSSYELTIKIDNSSIATINKDSIQSGEGFQVSPVAVGETKITVTSAASTAKKATLNVKVSDAPSVVAVTGVELDQSAVSLKVGETKSLVASVLPEDATNKEVTWDVENKDVVSVDKDGLVTALAVGTSKVSVTTRDGGFKAICEFTVTKDKSEPQIGHYYLMGDFTSTPWNEVDTDYELTENPGNPAEIMIAFDMAAGKSIKVMQYQGEDLSTCVWFNPDTANSGSGTYGTPDYGTYAIYEDSVCKIQSEHHYILYFSLMATGENVYKYWVVNNPTGGDK